MELPWNICPYCGTPELGMRKEGLSMDDVLRNLDTEEKEDLNPMPESNLDDEAIG
jgi:hypothetical protein